VHEVIFVMCAVAEEGVMSSSANNITSLPLRLLIFSIFLSRTEKTARAAMFRVSIKELCKLFK
jgi:hypothetical protein